MKFEKNGKSSSELILCPKAFELHEASIVITGLGTYIANNSNDNVHEASILAGKLDLADNRKKKGDKYEQTDIKVELTVSELELIVTGLHQHNERLWTIIKNAFDNGDSYSAAKIGYARTVIEEMIETIAKHESAIQRPNGDSSKHSSGHYL